MLTFSSQQQQQQTKMPLLSLPLTRSRAGRPPATRMITPPLDDTTFDAIPPPLLASPPEFECHHTDPYHNTPSAGDLITYRFFEEEGVYRTGVVVPPKDKKSLASQRHRQKCYARFYCDRNDVGDHLFAILQCDLSRDQFLDDAFRIRKDLKVGR